ncbi:unnamed protein product [Knipowitschia caucasica]|uniref:Secreted protein n=1 Tax=Knipowitschia caucasica TaxID=637954 RepID=A0AAV2L416_KNICA
MVQCFAHIRVVVTSTLIGYPSLCVIGSPTSYFPEHAHAQLFFQSSVKCTVQKGFDAVCLEVVPFNPHQGPPSGRTRGLHSSPQDAFGLRADALILGTLHPPGG